MRKPDPVTQVKRPSSGGFLHAAADTDVPMVTERWRKSRPRLPVDDDKESDGVQVDEETLAESRVRTGLANVDMRRRSAVVVTITSRRSLIEDDEGRRHSMLVVKKAIVYALLCSFVLPNYDATLSPSNKHLAPALSRVLKQFLSFFNPLYTSFDRMIV